MMHKGIIDTTPTFLQRLVLLLPQQVRRLLISPKKVDKAIVADYFSKNIDAQDDVWKATYAYHDPELVDAHHFEGSERTDKCYLCSRSRELVRWDDEVPQCLANNPMKEYNPYADFREKSEHVREIIRIEEEKYDNLCKRAEQEVPILFKKYGSDGEALAKLHHTHGYDLDLCSDFIDITKELTSSYNEWMGKESTLSKSKQKREIISIV